MGCVVISMTVRYHELGQMMGGRGPGYGNHASDVCACGCVMGTSQGTADHMLGGRQGREGCTAGL